MTKWLDSLAKDGRARHALVCLRRDETGQDAVEYALVGGMVGLVTAFAAPAIYVQVGEILTTAANLLADVV